jgi:hypothetical protein
MNWIKAQGCVSFLVSLFIGTIPALQRANREGDEAETPFVLEVKLTSQKLN